VTETILPLPFVLQAPRLFTGTIRLGDLTQSAGAFGKIEAGMSFIRNAYSQFASYNAAVIRLDGLAEANERARALPVLASQPSADGSVELLGVQVRTTTGEHLIDPVDLRLERGESPVRRAAARPRCCAASPGCGPLRPGVGACPPARTRRCSFLSCRTCR
jgi:putative ATP-binding cassette transporter